MGLFPREAASRLWRKAEKQLDIAISWGRHAELFAYDDDAAELYLESDDGKTAEKSFALTELYEAWPVLSIRERVEGFKLLQHDDAENFFLHLSAQRQGATDFSSATRRTEIVDEAARPR